jgi:hypothetical protein
MVWALAAAKVPPIIVIINNQGFTSPLAAIHILPAVVINSRGIIRGLVSW